MNEIKPAHTLEPALEAEKTEATTIDIRALSDLELALAGGGELVGDWP